MGHLVPKKVQIKGKNGRIFTAIRWVDPKTGEPVVAAKTKSVIDSKGGVEEKVIAILHANTTDADKIRHLVNEGIYDDSLIGLLVGMVPYHVRTHLTKAGIDPEEYKKKSAGKEDEIKKVIEEQQAHNDTPEDIENNMLLNTARDVERLWKGYDNNLESVVSGEDKFALCYGVGGVGKSYHCKQMLKKYEQRKFENEIQPDHDQYDYVIIKGKITPGQVYATMYRHRDKLIVFDDCDSFLITDAVQGYLKTGLDTDEDCEISNITSKPIYNIEGDKESGTIPNVFKFLGRVIAISNLTADDLDSAVLSRALPSNLSMTIDETLSQLEQVKDVVKLYTADKSEEIPISQEIRDKAFNLMKGFKNIVSDRANVRVLQRSMLIIKRGMEKGNNDLDIKREVLDNYRAIDNTFGKEQAALKLLAKEQKKNK